MSRRRFIVRRSRASSHTHYEIVMGEDHQRDHRAERWEWLIYSIYYDKASEHDTREKEGRRKVSKPIVCERKIARLLQWVCFSCILADGYPDFCTSRRFLLILSYLSFRFTFSTSKDIL